MRVRDGCRAAVLLGTVGLLACAAPNQTAPAAQPPTGSADRTAPAPTAPPAPALTSLTLVYSTASATNSPLQLAQDRGIFRDNGLDVELVHAPGNAGPAALLSGQALAMSSGCAEAVSAVAGGADFVFLLTTVNRMQYVLAGGPDVPDTASLGGRRLAVSRLGASPHLATKFILKHLGLDPERDVSYVQVGNTPERVAALVSGSVNATILSLDEGSLVGGQPGMRILVDMTTENVPYCAGGLVTRGDYSRDRPDVVRRLTKAFVEAIVRFKANKADGMDSVARFLGESDPQRIESIWSTWVTLFPDKAYPEPRGLQFVIDEVTQTDDRARSLATEQLIDPSATRELDQRRDASALRP